MSFETPAVVVMASVVMRAIIMMAVAPAVMVVVVLFVMVVAAPPVPSVVTALVGSRALRPPGHCYAEDGGPLPTRRVPG